jgi:hypothetical protein
MRVLSSYRSQQVVVDPDDHPPVFNTLPECMVMGRGLKPATMEVFLRVTIRVALDDAREFSQNVPP